MRNVLQLAVLAILALFVSSCGTTSENPREERDERQLLGPGGEIDRGQQAPNTP